MQTIQLHIKCPCGINKKVTEEEADRIAWLENGSFKCTCNRSIPYIGHGSPKGSKGAGWVTA